MSEKNLLIVDDEIISQKLLTKFFQNDYEIFTATNGEEALQILSENKKFSAIILDIVMPKMSGFEVLERIKNDVVLSSIPVVVMSVDENAEAKKKSLELGAVGFISKPLDSFEVHHTVDNIVKLHDSLFYNISQIDSLTGLYKREAFLDKISELVKSHPANYYVLSCFDVEKFKVINDLYGITFGDKVLKHIANCLKMAETELQGIASRLQSDKFAILYPVEHIGSEYYKHFHERLSTPNFFKKKIRIRIGRYRITDTSVPVHLIFDRAVLAEESIKGIYGKYIAEYTESMRTKLIEEQEIVSDSRRALMAGEFEVWFQPQYNNTSGSLIGAEALVRWRHKKKGLLDPGTFIPIFERNEFIYSIDKFMWEHVCMFIRKWIDEKKEIVPISVNISRVDIFKPDFFEKITGYVQKYNIPIDFLNLEVTESAFSESSNELIEIVSKLVKYGFTVEIDDFGCGYSSLNILKDVPSQVLKLDMKFLEDSNNSKKGGAIIESVIRMARWIGMTVIAEGVETKPQVDYLKSIGCFFMQGYYYSKPINSASYEKLLDVAVHGIKESSVKSIVNFNQNSFWDPSSIESLIFNSYIGGACIFELKDGKSELIRFNDRFIRELELSSEICLSTFSKNKESYLDKESADIFEKCVSTAIDTEDEASCEISYQNPAKDNKKEIIYLTVRNIARAEERYLLYCVLQNVTKQKEFEAKEKEAYRLKGESDKMLKTVMSNIKGGVSAILIDEDKKTSKMLFSNDKYYELYGYTEEKVLKDKIEIFSLILKEDIDCVMQHIKNLKKNRIPISTNFRIRKEDGSIAYLNCNCSIVQLLNISNDIIISVLTDTTEEHLLCEEKRQSEEQLSFLHLAAKNILLQSNSDDAINELLKNLQSFFNSDRCYIFENNDKKGFATITYDTSVKGIVSKKDLVTDVSYSYANNLMSSLQKDKCFYLNDTSEIQNKKIRDDLKSQKVNSVLIIPININGNLIGCFGVDNPRRENNDIEKLGIIGDYIAVILNKRDLLEKIEKKQ
jgi:diguanylate cyclase (GGDEF)-like protein/PAS domain S-box-containing protein